PEKWHGLTDTEARYRQRYVDLIMNPESRAVFAARSAIVRAAREYFVERGFLEVETPMLQAIPGGAAARPFVTHYNALDHDFYLRVAPELYLKRLVVGGLERVFELNRNFRNEGVSTRHNPEFSMLEVYLAYADHNLMMDLIEGLLTDLSDVMVQSHADARNDDAIELAGPFARVPMGEAVCAHNPDLPADALRDAARLAEWAQTKGIKGEPFWGWGKWLTEIFEQTVEDRLNEPTFVIDYPAEVSPLS